MKNKRLLGIAVLIAIGLSSYSLVFGGEGDAKLVNKSSGLVVVEFIDHKPHFFDPVLEKQMGEDGIAIPLALRSLYGDKERVFLGDDDFEKAFCELFYKYSFDGQVYQWEAL